MNSREITIAKTLRPGTNIRVVMSIVEEELHSTEISRLARVEYAPTAIPPYFFLVAGEGGSRIIDLGEVFS